MTLLLAFSCSIVSNSLWAHKLQHVRLPCPSPPPGVSHVHWVSDAIQQSHPLTSPSPPAFNLSQHQSFPRSQLFTSGSQTTGTSTSVSVLLTNIQDWFPLGWTGWISLQSKGLSRVFSSTTVWRHSSMLSLFYCPALTSIQDYWKNHSFNYMDFCRQSNVSAF